MQPCRISKQELESASTEDTDLREIRDALTTGDWTNVPIQFKTLGIKEQLSQYGNLILRGDRIVIPAVLQRRVAEIAHLGHQGATAMKAHLRSRLWFPGLDLVVENTLKTCKECTMMAKPDPPCPMARRLPTLPWQDLVMDFIEGLPNDYSLLVVVCYTTRYTMIEPMKHTTSSMVIIALLKMFSKFGIPQSMTTDNGPQFRAMELKRFCHSYNIHHNLTTPYWPERNSAVERQNRNLKKRIKISVAQETDWIRDLYEYLLFYHSTPQETTGLSPAKMMLNRELISFLPTIQEPHRIFLEGAKERDALGKERKKQYANEHRYAKENDLLTGDTVLIRNMKLGSTQSNFQAEEFEVTNVNGSELGVRSKETGKEYTRNRVHVKKLPTNLPNNAGTQSSPERTVNDELHSRNTDEDNVDQTNLEDVPPEDVSRPRRNRNAPRKYNDFFLYQ